jgi:hypothetical protein
MLFPILICSVATISVIIKKICYPTDREMTRTLLIDPIDAIDAIDAIEILKQNPDNINWEDAIDAIDAMNAINAEILKANPDKISWGNLSKDAMVRNVNIKRSHYTKTGF